MVNSDTKKEAQPLMAQGKQPLLIVNGDPSSETLLPVVPKTF